MATKKYEVRKGTWIELPAKLGSKQVQKRIEAYCKKLDEANNNMNAFRYS